MRYLTAVDTSPTVRSTSAADHVGTDLPAALWMATVSAADGGNAAAVIEVKSVSDEQTVRPPAFAMGQPLSTISSPDAAAERLEGLHVGGVLELNRQLLMTPEFEDPGNVNNNNGFDTADFPPPPPSAFLYCQLPQQPDEPQQQRQHQMRQLNKSCYDVGDRLGNVRYRAEDDATGNIEEDEDTDPDSGTGEDVRSMRDSVLYCDGPNMGPKGDMVYSLLSILGTHNRDDMSRTLLAMSTSFDSCVAMRQAGCLPLLVSLLHPNESTHDHVYQVDDCGFKTYSEEEQATRARAAAALHNIVVANCDSPNGRLEARVLQLLAQIRMYCDQSRLVQQLMLSSDDASEIAPVDMHPGPAVAALMKCSFDEDYRHAICSLGGLQAVAELIQTDNDIVGSTDHVYHVTMRRYACMTLTNLTFGDATNKSLLCSNMSSLRAVVAQLDSPSEDLCQVAASVLRNLSWHSDTASKRALREAGAVRAIVQSALLGVRRESTLKSLLSALWNLSSHGPENKAEICSVPGALEFLVAALGYRGPSKTVAVAENAGGVLRNISSHVAGSEEHRAALRRAGCLPVLLQQLRSPSLTIVSNACGTLWNLSARCPEDQRTLLSLGAVAMLKNLVNSRHRMISMGSAAALKNLLTAASSLGYGTNGSASVSLLLETPMTRSDSAASGPAPGLYMRRQRAFEEELNRRQLSETCENMESPNTSPTGTLENRSGSLRASSASASFSMPTAGRRLQSPSPVRASVLAGRLANVAAQSSVCRSASSGGIVGSADNIKGEHRVRDVLHRSGRLLRDPSQLTNGSMTQSLSIATSRQTELRENRSSYDKISCISSSPSPETSPAVSPISFEQRALKSRSFLKKSSCANRALDTDSGNGQLGASSSVVSASSFISKHSENIHLGDIGGTSPSDGNDSDTATASVDISTLMIEAPLEFADKTEAVADSKTFLPNEDIGRQMSFENWLEQTTMATSQRRNSRSGNVFHFNDSHRLSTVLESTGSEISMTTADDFIGSPVQVQGRELANCLDRATTDCKQSNHCNLPVDLPESAGNSRTTSGVVIDLTELFCSKPAPTKRTGHKDSCQTVTSSDNGQIVSPSSPVKTPINNVFDCYQLKCLDDQFASVGQLSTDQFPMLLSSPTAVTSKQLASTALGDNSADIMMESFPGAMISSQLSDTLMTSSTTGDIQVTQCNQSAIPEQTVSKNSGKTVQLGNSDLSISVECVVNSNLEEAERESAGDDASSSSLLTAKLFSGSSSSELDRMLAENTSTVLMALDSCQMTSGSGTSTSGSSAGEVHLIEDETISLISIEDVDSFIGDDDDDDDDYNDAVSNRTYDVRNSDVREDTSVNSSIDCSFTSDLDEDSCAFRQRRPPSVCSSSASRDSSAHDGEPAKPVSVSRPRIVKPGDASAPVKPAADDKVNEPKGIRGKRKSLYPAARGGIKPAHQQNGAKAATTAVSKNTAVLKPGSPVTKKANSFAGAGRKLPGIPNTSSSSVKSVSGQNKTNGPALKTALTPPGNVLQQQQQQKRAIAVRGRGKANPASVTEPGPGNRASSAASSRENSVGKRLQQQPVDRSQNAALSRPDADSRNGSAKSQLKQPVSNNAAKGQTSSSTAVDSNATSDAGVDGGNRPSVRQAAVSNEDSKQKSSSGSSNAGDSGKAANSSGSNTSAKTSKQSKPEVKPRTVSLKPASSTISPSAAANATEDRTTLKPVGGSVAAASNTKPGATVAAKANAVVSKSSVSVASGIRPAVATRTRSLGASVTGSSSKAAPTSQPAAQNQQNSNSSSTPAQKSRTSSPCSPVMPRRGSATSGLNASRSRTSSAGSISSLGARSSAAVSASVAGAAQSVNGATTASGSSGRRGSNAGVGQQTSCHSNVHPTSLPPASKVSRGAKKQPGLPEATKSTEVKDGAEVKSRNTYVLMRSSTYDKLTAECDPGNNAASKTSSAAPCEATEDGVTGPANDGEKQRPQQPVARNSTFTKRKAQPASATSAEEPAKIAQTEAEKPAQEDVVVVRRQRKSTEIHNAPSERRSGHRQSGAFDPQGNGAGVSKDSHRKSRHSALLVKSEQSAAVEPAVSQSCVQQTCKLANSVPGVLSEVRQNPPDEKLKSTTAVAAATSSSSSPVRKFGFIGGFLRRNNRATTLPRPSRDSSTDDSVTAVKVSGNLSVGDRKKQSATLPAGTASSLSKFIASDGKSKSQKSIPEQSSPKRSSFNWWKRTPSSITATTSTGVSSDVVATTSNAACDNAEAASKPVRRSRIPGAFALGIGSRKTTNQQPPERSPISPSVQTLAVDQPINANSTTANVPSVSPTCRAAIVSPFNYRPPAAATAPTEETTVTAAAVTSESDPAPPLALTKTAMLIERRRMQRAKMAANLSSGALSTMSDDTDKMVLSSTSVSLQSYTEMAVSSPSKEDFGDSLKVEAAPGLIIHGDKGKANFLVTTV